MNDAAALADLRWRFQTDDTGRIPENNDFADMFTQSMREETRFVHWIAEKNGVLIAMMSVEKVVKLPSPGDAGKRYWGYLTNCYTVPEYRNQGLGSNLLSKIKAWARDEKLEFLAVWPSERSYDFYRRAGFVRPPDPLVLELDLTGVRT
jgi:GNAT superfamily N-acetyltransferase